MENPNPNPVQNISAPNSAPIGQPSASEIARREYPLSSRGENWAGSDRLKPPQNPQPSDNSSNLPVNPREYSNNHDKNQEFNINMGQIFSPEFVKQLALAYRAQSVTTGEVRQIIKSYEGLSLQAYKKDGDKWTIGYGHTGPDVHPGLIITKDQAEQLLTQDILKAANEVNSLVKVPLSINQYKALVIFDYNIGPNEEGFGGSTLLKKLNHGDYNGAADQFQYWVHGPDKKVLAGLVLRRKREKEIFERK